MTARVVVFGLGGTIAMTSSAAGGVTPTLSPRQLLDAVPGLADHGVDLTAVAFRNRPIINRPRVRYALSAPRAGVTAPRVGLYVATLGDDGALLGGLADRVDGSPWPWPTAGDD